MLASLLRISFYAACIAVIVLQVLTYFLGFSSIGEFLWGQMP